MTIAKAWKTDFHEIPFTVEIPDDLSYYHEIDSIIENVQKKKPIIQRSPRTFEGGGTWEEPTAEGEEQKKPINLKLIHSPRSNKGSMKGWMFFQTK